MAQTAAKTYEDAVDSTSTVCTKVPKQPRASATAGLTLLTRGRPGARRLHRSPRPQGCVAVLGRRCATQTGVCAASSPTPSPTCLRRAGKDTAKDLTVANAKALKVKLI